MSAFTAGKAVVDFTGDDSRLQNASSRVMQTLQGLQRRMQQVALIGLGLFAGAATAAVTFAAQAQQTEVAFSTMLGSGERAKQLMRELQDFAASTPFELPGIQAAARKLLAFGVAADDIIPTLRRVGDIAAGVGISMAELAEIYGKAKVQGRLFAEDVNQLTGRGIPVIQELARQFNVTESEVRKLVETGQIGFEQLQQAFVSLTSEGGKFAGMMDEQSKTFLGHISTIKDNVRQILMDLGAEVLPVVSSMTQALVETLPAMRAYVNLNSEAILTTAKWTAVTLGLVVVVPRVVSAVYAARTAVMGLTVALRTMSVAAITAKAALYSIVAVAIVAGIMALKNHLSQAADEAQRLGKEMRETEQQAAKLAAVIDRSKTLEEEMARAQEVGNTGRQADALREQIRLTDELIIRVKKLKAEQIPDEGIDISAFGLRQRTVGTGRDIPIDRIRRTMTGEFNENSRQFIIGKLEERIEALRDKLAELNQPEQSGGQWGLVTFWNATQQAIDGARQKLGEYIIEQMKLRGDFEDRLRLLERSGLDRDLERLRQERRDMIDRARELYGDMAGGVVERINEAFDKQEAEAREAHKPIDTDAIEGRTADRARASFVGITRAWQHIQSQIGQGDLQKRTAVATERTARAAEQNASQAKETTGVVQKIVNYVMGMDQKLANLGIWSN